MRHMCSTLGRQLLPSRKPALGTKGASCQIPVSDVGVSSPRNYAHCGLIQAQCRANKRKIWKISRNKVGNGGGLREALSAEQQANTLGVHNLSIQAYCHARPAALVACAS
eukprot:1138875-Pelagomonas_calceolata.AAC.5